MKRLSLKVKLISNWSFFKNSVAYLITADSISKVLLLVPSSVKDGRISSATRRSRRVGNNILWACGNVERTYSSTSSSCPARINSIYGNKDRNTWMFNIYNFYLKTIYLKLSGLIPCNYFKFSQKKMTQLLNGAGFVCHMTDESRRRCFSSGLKHISVQKMKKVKELDQLEIALRSSNHIHR